MAEAIVEEYLSSLVELNFNSKPHINMLTMLAEENVKYAPMIVETILKHINSVSPELKLPGLYLVDSIMKNVGGQYITLFSKHMISIFSSVFEKVEEATRSALYKLRQTWNVILPKNVLYGIDLKVNGIDPAWPITAIVTAPPVAKAPAVVATVMPVSPSTIHVNPKFLGADENAENAGGEGSKEKSLANIPKEPTVKDKEQELKKKQAEMLRLIEEKKTQLKALEQKKLEMAAKQKLNVVFPTPVANAITPQVMTHKKIVNHRDPRLKKSIVQTQAMTDIKGPVSLQSVVVVPNSKLPPDLTNGNMPDKSKEEKPSAVNTSHEHSTTNKGSKPTEKFSKVSPKNKNNAQKESSVKNSKKRGTSPENKLGSNAKRHCKPSQVKTKRVHLQEKDNLKNDPHPSKKHKNELSKSKNKTNSGSTDERLDANEVNHNLFGVEDQDYRHQLRSVEQSNKHVSESKSVCSTSSRASQEVFKSTELNSAAIPTSLPDRISHSQKVILPGSVVEQNPVAKQIFVETYRPNVDKKENIKVDNLDRGYTSVPVVPTGRMPLPPTSSIMLDGKNRVINFINSRAITVLDNNEPREVSFAGPPRNVHVEGLPHPLVLGFDARPVEFLTGGKLNIMHFGAPSREIYVNNIPYEAKFGGPPFSAVLEDQKEHKILIDGPPPQVLISDKPAYDLYEYLNLNRKEPEERLVQDVDMRVKPSQVAKDIDWRHVASSSDAAPVPWNVPQNSFETYTDVPGARNFTHGVPSITAPMEYHTSTNPMTATSDHFRNNQQPWPHPGYRPTHPNDRPMDLNSQHIPPNMTWESQNTLPPPPIPPSMSLPGNASNMGLPGSMMNLRPSWNPLPPPPMFGSGGHDVRLHMVPNPVQTEVEPVAPLPINVNSIFEKLVAAGIIPKTVEEPSNKNSVEEPAKKEEKTPAEPKEEDEIVIPDIRLTPKCLRKFNPAIIVQIYKGSQCATCGMRFKEIQSEQYSRHLDWHFRMNRREKDGAKKAYSRRFYYELRDWVEFKEIEEAEERMPSYFELQTDGDSSKSEEDKIQSVPASACESEKCSVCGEQFQLFWVEEEEEWHLKHAVRHDGEAYHPMCYEDHKKAIELANKPVEEAPEENLTVSIKEESEEPMSTDQELPIKEEDIKKEIKEEDIKKEVEDSTEPSKEKLVPEEKESELSPEENMGDSLKKEPEGNVDTSDKEKSEEVNDMEVDKDKGEESKETDKVEKSEESAKVPVPEKNAEPVGSPEIEFRPPTPDPRFKVLEPVFKGTELSALCSIM